jgi:hypothetical protein
MLLADPEVLTVTDVTTSSVPVVTMSNATVDPSTLKVNAEVAEPNASVSKSRVRPVVADVISCKVNVALF